jgi:hypothetical protein
VRTTQKGSAKTPTNPASRFCFFCIILCTLIRLGAHFGGIFFAAGGVLRDSFTGHLCNRTFLLPQNDLLLLVTHYRAKRGPWPRAHKSLLHLAKLQSLQNEVGRAPCRCCRDCGLRGGGART